MGLVSVSSPRGRIKKGRQMSQDAILDRRALTEAILPIVPFEGWSDTAFTEATQSLGLTSDMANAIAPRGATDLAVTYHYMGDRALRDQMAGRNFDGVRYNDRVVEAIMMRLELSDREVVRRATALFALPHLASDGAALVWHTADTIWNALGDTSEDGNWYSKRTILSGVYGACVLYWLGDESGGANTREFVERRIQDVMRIEGAKSALRKSPIGAPLMKGFDGLMGAIGAPSARLHNADEWPGQYPEDEKNA